MVKESFFVRLSKNAESEENLFTECLAETLRASQSACHDFLRIVCGGSKFCGSDIESANIAITTQVCLGEDSRIDMVFDIGGAKLGIENKLYSSEGEGQLGKYLSYVPSELNFVAYITAYEAEINKIVIDDEHYLKPKYRNHHMWGDFYKVFGNSSSSGGLQTYMKLLFEHYGFDPPDPKIGDMDIPKNKKNFAKFWSLTKQRFEKRGWQKPNPSRWCELYISPSKSDVLDDIWLNPWRIPNNLTIRIYPKTPDCLALIEMKLKSELGVSIQRSLSVDKERGKIGVVDVITPFKTIISDAKTAEDIQVKLADHVCRVIDVAEGKNYL